VIAWQLHAINNAQEISPFRAAASCLHLACASCSSSQQPPDTCDSGAEMPTECTPFWACDLQHLVQLCTVQTGLQQREQSIMRTTGLCKHLQGYRRHTSIIP
jgi:hypothetical protein